ncbi:beta-lactamase [Exophiala viscosa]|uniref:Beta-lactamase n=1 Tax=Exophiala viscosa TaxID=2486360 RepID=A0AAN6I8A8_9EURO|nr:beta-lactamase [Exophiala viscosa]
MAEVQGHFEPAFQNVRDRLQNNINDGVELGAAICIIVDGKVVVDIYGGFKDEERTDPWVKDTIVNVWSSTKNISTLAALVLHDRGLLDVNENVSKYWPEFAANGKENIKVRHVLSHTSGVSAWERPFNTNDAYDLKQSTDRLAQQAPWWKPGSASGYQAINMGHLIGELVRRVTGKSLKQFVAEDIAGPLGADFQIGALETDWPRIATLIPPPAMPVDLSTLDENSVAVKTFSAPALDALAGNTAEWRRAEIGAANGHGNARSLARILSVITLDGKVDGHKLLSPETIDLIFHEQADGVDLAIGKPIRFGIGYAIAGGGSEESIPFVPRGKDRRACFWGGWGGSYNLMDVDKRVNVSYVMNKMGPGTLGSPRTGDYIEDIYSSLS